MQYLAIDTETTLIEERKYVTSKSGAKVFTSPYRTPNLLFAATFDGRGIKVHDASGAAAFISGADPKVAWIFHNASFDLDVLLSAGAISAQEIERRLREGLIHDTMYLDMLYRLAQGHFDEPIFDPQTRRWSTSRLQPRALSELGAVYGGVSISKDPTIRLGFAQFAGMGVDALPPAFLDYIKQDALVTGKVYEVLQKKITDGGFNNWLSESTQLRAAWVAQQMDKQGTAIDDRLAAKLCGRFQDFEKPLQLSLVEHNLGCFRPVPKSTTRLRLDLASPLPDLNAEWTLYDSKDTVNTPFSNTPAQSSS